MGIPALTDVTIAMLGPQLGLYSRVRRLSTSGEGRVT